MQTQEGYHVGIILDGNGRWATAQGKPRLFGHRAGVEGVLRIVRCCPEHNVKILTLYAFAIANWKRDKEEVDGLWDLFRNFFQKKLDEMIENGVRIRVIGDRAGLPADVQEMVTEAEARSKDNDTVLVQMALNYDGVNEVVRAARIIAAKVRDGELDEREITDTLLARHLDTADVKDPDIVIRTGMPQVQNETGMALWRSSSFLQLQSAQSVCVSTPRLWPDFTGEDLAAAIAFAKPDERLFGGQRT